MEITKAPNNAPNAPPRRCHDLKDELCGCYMTNDRKDK